MKVLYALQGTGNGHIGRALEIIPILKKKVDLDILISGTQADLKLPFDVKYKLHGLSFIFGNKGGVDIVQTWKTLDVKKLIESIRNLPVRDYDLVINDFEPVSAWACRLSKVPCIALSHQSAVLNRNAPKPAKNDQWGRIILRHYAPAMTHTGFHFMQYADNIYTPVIRREIRYASTKNKGHYTVYLPAYGDEQIIRVLSVFSGIRWEVFSKHSQLSYTTGNITVTPVNNRLFINSMVSCEGILCGAGFETPAEALYLGKKLMVIPMSGQFEQQCNAAALRKLGVPVIEKLSPKSIFAIAEWIYNSEPMRVNYPDETEKIIDRILKNTFNNQISGC